MLPANQRMLFQSSLRPVKLAQSSCNAACYDVLLYGVPQIITSNHFWKGWQADDPEHREARQWLEANMCYVQWNESCYRPELPVEEMD